MGGPRSDLVDAELDNIIAWAKLSPRVIKVDTSVVGNVGTGLDTLHTYSLPAGSLATNNDFLEIEYGGNFGSNNDDKRLVNQIDGNTHEDTGLIDIDALGWSLRLYVVRLSATSVLAHSVLDLGILQIDSAGTTTITGIGGRMNQRGQNITVANLNSNAITLLVKGESATATNDNVTQYLSIIKLYQQ